MRGEAEKVEALTLNGEEERAAEEPGDQIRVDGMEGGRGEARETQPL